MSVASRSGLLVAIALLLSSGARGQDGAIVFKDYGELYSFQDEHDPSRRVVVFLGDNAYPRGLPAPNQPGRHIAELNLAAQVKSAYSLSRFLPLRRTVMLRKYSTGMAA